MCVLDTFLMCIYQVCNTCRLIEFSVFIRNYAAHRLPFGLPQGKPRYPDYGKKAKVLKSLKSVNYYY